MATTWKRSAIFPADPLFPAVLLAGGLARRMGGGDKCLVPLAGQPLLAHAIARIRPQAAALLLNANGDPDRFSPFGLPVAADPVPGFLGPLAGVLAGMRWAAGLGAAQVLSLPTDTPFFPEDLAKRLAAAPTALAPIACAASDGAAHPVFALWPVALADRLEAALLAGLRRVDGFTQDVGRTMVSWPAEPFDPFFNVNTVSDLAVAEARVRTM